VPKGLVEQDSDGECGMLLLGQSHRRFIAGSGALYLTGDEAGLSEPAQGGDTVRSGQLWEVQQSLVDGDRLFAGTVGGQGRA
jgi:hypothetical protein